MHQSRFVGTICAVVAFAGSGARPAAAIVPEAGSSALAAKEFAAPELAISSANVPLAEIRSQLPSRAAWDALYPGEPPPFSAFIDPRSGAATSIVESVPLLPGTGFGNRVTLDDVARRLGRAVPSIDARAVADVVLAHVREREAVLGIDAAQLGPVRATPVNPELWQVSIPQRYRGVPVRYGRVLATISHGNLVLLGAETWGDVALEGVEPAIGAGAALEAGFAYAGGRSGEDEVLAEPALEIVPFAPPEHQAGERFAGPVGRGYGHRLVWTFTFRRAPSPSRWEVTVDAQGGAVLAMRDRNHYAARPIAGGVYPLTSTEACPFPEWCGFMESRWPMPFADTGQPAPNAFANSAGVYDYVGGTAVTRLRGRFVRMNDGCTPFPLDEIEQSAPNGAIDMGGVTGDHDCDGAFGGGGDTAAARTTYYEANRIAEIARGYLPANDWVRGQLVATTNKSIGFESCNAFWDGASVNFFASGGGCRNAGEIASIVDHEWAHGLDDNDANGIPSNSSEGYADIAAVFRTHDSCVGRGLFEARDFGCGTSVDGGGFNVDEAQVGDPHCTTFCPGVREADFVRHADRVPDTPANHVCTRCSGGDGPCGREAHCASAPQLQAAWDLKREMSVEEETGFLLASRIFYQGSGNIGSWYACGCGGGANTSNGCGAGNAYMQWLATDDDNGTIADGTPHMKAIFHALKLHGIACNAPTVQNSSCPAELTRPTLTVTPGVLQNTLTWTKVLAAPRYQVFRSDGNAGCDYGKAKIAEVDALTFIDRNVATGRTYAYSVLAVGAQSTCFSPASNCTLAKPVGAFTLACAPQAVTPGPSAATCTVQATGGFMGPVNLGCQGLPSGVASCALDPSTVTPFPDEPASSTLRIEIGPFTQPGNYPFQVRGVAPPNLAGPTTPLTLTVGPAAGGDLFATFDQNLGAPACGPLVGRSCDTRTLVVGRAQLGPEPNQPNAIGSCPDGPDGSGSNDRIRVATTDGAPFAPGRKVVISATVDARGAFEDDRADFFFAADAEHPVWQLVGSAVPTGPGPQTLEAVYTLPAGARQAVRVQFRSGGTPDACAPGAQDDRDDLVFAVAP